MQWLFWCEMLVRFPFLLSVRSRIKIHWLFSHLHSTILLFNSFNSCMKSAINAYKCKPMGQTPRPLVSYVWSGIELTGFSIRSIHVTLFAAILQE